nr:hypothetical protein [Tanacetum cinerariifolium]
MPLMKKEKMDFNQGKGIELLSQVALTEDAQFKEVQRKRTGVKPGVLDVTKEELSESEVESWGNDEDDTNNKQDSSDFEHETNESESGLDSDHEENKEDEDDEEEVKDELIKTPSNDSNDEDETKITDKAEGDEDEEMDYTTSQLYDDGNENPKILQVIEDAHVTLSTVPQTTEVLVTSSSHSSDLVAKFLKFSDIPNTDAEIVSPMDVYVHHEVPSQQTPTLLTVLVSVFSDSSSKRKTSKDIEPTKSPKAKESQSGSSKGDNSQSKSSGKSVQSEEPEFEIADSDMPQD